MRKHKIKAGVLKILKDRGFYTIELRKKNEPDILACGNGKFYGIEVKTEKGVVSPLQWRNLDKIREAYGVGLVVRSAKEMSVFLDNIESYAKKYK